jgi:transcriptional regulator with XRE-family HTH domain
MKVKKPRPRSPAVKKPAAFSIASKGLGSRLRLARERNGMSLRELARRVGVSPSLVSQIELERVKPSVGTLYSMSNELGLLLDELFRDAVPKPVGRGRPARAATGPVQRRNRRKSLKLAAGVRWERLTAAPDDEVEFLYVAYDAGAASCEEDSLIRHGGKEYTYVISGRLGMKIGFEEYELGPGDSVSFDANSPHRLWTIGREPAVAIWVVLNRHGDRRTRKAT